MEQRDNTVHSVMWDLNNKSFLDDKNVVGGNSAAVLVERGKAYEFSLRRDGCERVCCGDLGGDS